MGFAANIIKGFARRIGFDIVRIQPDRPGRDPFLDMQRLYAHSGAEKPPLIFDVGANVGQSLQLFRSHFPNCSVHSFEPSPDPYHTLQASFSGIAGITTWNVGVGAVESNLEFFENDASVMSSFLSPNSQVVGTATRRKIMIPLISLDNFTVECGIEHIDILKTDTQGFDLEVFKGAQQLMQHGRISIIYTELNFHDMYHGIPRYDEIFRYLADNNFFLVTFYHQTYHEHRLSWTDGLFVHCDFYESMQSFT